MNFKPLVFPIIVLTLMAINAQGLEADIAATSPTNKIWKQTDWFGEEGIGIVEEEDRGAFADYYFAESVLMPPGELEVGVHTIYLGIDENYPEPGDKNIKDILLFIFGFVAAADIPGGSPPVKVYYSNFGTWAEKLWQEAPAFPPANGDTVIGINSLSVTAENFGFRFFLYAGVTMSGGYGGAYVAEVLFDPDQGQITGISNWTYLEGPGNPAGNPQTIACTDIFGFEGYSDRVICATGESGVISYYDGSGFTNAFIGGDETVYKISEFGGDTRMIMALTGPNGKIYYANLSTPYGPNYWNHSGFDTLESSDILDHFVFGNYHYYAGVFPAAVYRQGGESGIGATGDLPPDIFETPVGVYSLGHIGNLVLAGTGDYGLLYGSRDTGDNWAIASVLGEGTRIVSMLDLGVLYPLIVLAGAEGDYGGLYAFGAPAYAALESSALHINSADTHFDRINWDVDVNGGQVIVQVRTFDNRDMSDSMPWDVPDPDNPGETDLNPDTIASNGAILETLPSVRRGDRYLQYRVILVSSDTGESPVFKEIRLGYGSLGYDSLLPEDEVHAVPNPATGGECRIYYALSADAEVTAEIYDLKGRLVWSESESGWGLDPDQFIAWDTSNVAPGVYVYRVHARAGDDKTDSVVKKVAVLK